MDHSSGSREALPLEKRAAHLLLPPPAPAGTPQELPRMVKTEEELVVREVQSIQRIRLRDIATERLELMAERMQHMPIEYLEELKTELREILTGSGGNFEREEFALLQKVVMGRRDVSYAALMKANRTQLEILVAIKTGIQAFLHPDISLTHSVLVEVFLHKRCRNMACQSKLPVDDCNCEVCNGKGGFCNACMCAVCSKFDFEVNTCRWIGCDSCSHWTHTDCAIRSGQICQGSSLKKGEETSEMVFKCKACGYISELLGWVKDIFKACAADWSTEDLVKELDFVRRIFHGSNDIHGKRLHWKTDELLAKLHDGIDQAAICKELVFLFQVQQNTIVVDLTGIEEENAEVKMEDTKIIDPQEACNRIAEVVREAVQKIENAASERSCDLKRARSALDLCNRELEDKKREFTELQYERHCRKKQVEELEKIISLKQAEAEMFQLRADQARREANELQRIAHAKSEKAEEEYASRYLKLRLNEAEAERRYLSERIKLQEYTRNQQDSSEMDTRSKIQYLLDRAATYSRQGINRNEGTI